MRNLTATPVVLHSTYIVALLLSHTHSLTHSLIRYLLPLLLLLLVFVCASCFFFYSVANFISLFLISQTSVCYELWAVAAQVSLLLPPRSADVAVTI